MSDYNVLTTSTVPSFVSGAFGDAERDRHRIDAQRKAARETDALAHAILADQHMPSDLRERAAAWKMEAFMEAVWRAGWQSGFRVANAQRERGRTDDQG